MPHDFKVSIPIVKFDRPRGLVTGWAAISTDDTGAPVIDHDGEYIPVVELEKAAQTAFVKHGGRGKVGDMHQRTGVCDLVESFVLTAEKRKALGLGDPLPGHPAEGWVVTVKINDPELLRQVVDGDKLELSIRGSAQPISIEEWRAREAA